MRITSLIPYLYEEKNIINTYDEYEHSLYIQNIFICTIYIFKKYCSSCGIECYTVACYKSKQISKIACCKFVRYKFYCSNKLDLYDILLDGKMIKD
jgi:hypothetical protein